MALKDNKIKSIIVDFVNYFNNNSIPYVLIGGLAVNIWGRIRTTMDADFIIDQSKLDIEEFLAYLQERKYEITSQDIIFGLPLSLSYLILNFWKLLILMKFFIFHNLFNT
ncbi:hypothetical protein LCGC14_2447600 [marine sediment metagenome]|uniref:Poly A polymerase head domain-containing protein n=1 Tax=marine sediment metagenome TaxID=412755 RepID=A0A0F9C4N6_9ZZZZ